MYTSNEWTVRLNKRHCYWRNDVNDDESLLFTEPVYGNTFTHCRCLVVCSAVDAFNISANWNIGFWECSLSRMVGALCCRSGICLIFTNNGMWKLAWGVYSDNRLHVTKVCCHTALTYFLSFPVNIQFCFLAYPQF